MDNLYAGQHPRGGCSRIAQLDRLPELLDARFRGMTVSVEGRSNA
jgi:hypothetical protein